MIDLGKLTVTNTLTVKPYQSTDSHRPSITEIHIDAKKSMAQGICSDCQNKQTQEQISIGLILR